MDDIKEHSTQLKEKQSNDLCTSTWLSSSSSLLLLLLLLLKKLLLLLLL